MRSTRLRLVPGQYACRSLLILGLAWLSGCAGSGSVQGGWQASTPQLSFARVLIVGVDTDYNERCNFEFAMASQFTGTTPQPIVSCNFMTQTDALTRANIDRVAAAQHAGGVLTTAIVSLQIGEQKGNVIPYYKVTGQGYVTGALGDYGIPVAFVKLETMTTVPTVTGDIHLVTKLFDVKDASLVYSSDTQAKSDDLQSSSTAIETLTGLIGNRLRRDGVIH